MTVLYAGTRKPIDWHKPPTPTTTVLWDRKDIYGRDIVGSFRAIAHLDLLDRRAVARFGQHIRIIQSMNHKGYAPSAGTHDEDFTIDADIPGVPWVDVNHFFRSNGHAGWVRTPAQGFSYHWHGFTLPPREGKSISDDFKVHGFRVGKYVDGGYSLFGRLVTSSQIADYYAKAFGLSGFHRPGSDKSWYPKDIVATIFDLDREIARQRTANPKPAPKPQPIPPKPVTPTLSVREVAQEVLDGKWGNGPDRERRLRSAGYNVRQVQAMVNTLVSERNKPAPKPVPKPDPVSGNHVDFRVGQMSMRYSRTLAEWKKDAEKLFSLGYRWVTGTEAGEADNFAVLKDVANAHGYKIVRMRDVWIAVQNTAVKPGTWKVEGEVVAENTQTWGRGHDTVVLGVSWTDATPGVGKITVLASHYPNKGKPYGTENVNLKWTKETARTINEMGRRLAGGRSLAFYGGDQNMSDKIADTFFGGPFVSAGDELGKYPNTGFGPIDVIARWGEDVRTSFIAWGAYTDKEKFFYSDHYLTEAIIRIVLLP